jgi:hypothetical protein
VNDRQTQGYADLMRLLGTVRTLPVPDPKQQAVREELLKKMTALADTPVIFAGGRQSG